MNNKMKKALALLIALGMMSGTIPPVMAEGSDTKIQNAEISDAVEISEAAADENSEEAAEDDNIADIAASDNPMIIDKSFENSELGSYSDGINYLKVGTDQVKFEVVNGEEAGRSGKILKINQAAATKEKMQFAPVSIGNDEYGARKIVTSLDIRAESTSSFNLTLANGTSNKNIGGGFRLDGGNIQVWSDNEGKGTLYYEKTGTKYNVSEWHTLMMVTDVNEDNKIVSQTYYIDGIKVSQQASSEKCLKEAAVPTMFRLDFTDASSGNIFYIDNFSMVDVLPQAEAVTESFKADSTIDISNYLTKDEDKITVPTEYNGTKLIWESSNKSVIDTDKINENGEIPVTHTALDENVILTAKVKISGMYGIEYPSDAAAVGSSGKEFTVSVQNNTGEESDESKANRIALSLEPEEKTVSGDFVLPSKTDIVESGAEITWSSEDTSLITIDGMNAKVTRPAFDSENKTAKVTVTVKYGKATASKSFGITVVRNSEPVTDAEKIRYTEAELKKLGLSESNAAAVSLGESIISAETKDIFAEKGISFTILSGDEEWISNEGIVMKQPEKGEGKKEVNVAVTVMAGAEKKTFNYVVAIQPRQAAKAYPGAQGYGTQTRGGAGGYVYHVTTLAADGPGSLKYGMETATGNRIIVFDVGGTIDLTSVGRALTLKGDQGSHVTIAGQTAPGDGIQLKGYGFAFSNIEDVIVRNIKIRIGNVRKAGDTYQSDPLSVSGSNKRVVLDHLTMNWNVDMGFRVYGSEITMSNCMITKALYYNTPHEKGKHNYAGMFGPKYGSFYNNYIADMGQRAPRIIDNEYIDVRNNVVYNSDRSFDICNYEWMGVNAKFNIVNNSVLIGNPDVSKRDGGSYKYFQGRTYSGGVFTYTVNNIDNTTNSRAHVSESNLIDGGIWNYNTSAKERNNSLDEELKVINPNEYANIATTWRNMVLPDNISLDDYDTTTVSKNGNTLVNYPFPADEVTTRSPEDATKYVFDNVGAIYPLSDTLQTRYLAEGRTRLKIDSDYSKCSSKQGIRLTDSDIANMKDADTAYGLPVETHTIYEDKNGALSYDVDGLNVTDTTGLTIKDQFKFVTFKGDENEKSKNPDVKTLYVYDVNNEHKYRVVLNDYKKDATGYDSSEDIYDAFEVYDINGEKLIKPNDYATVGKTNGGLAYTTQDGKKVILTFTQLGDGPGNYAHETDPDDPFADSSVVDTEWTEEDWPQLQTVYRESKEDKERSPEQYVNDRFDSNGDGIPDFFVKLKGWDKRADYNPNRDISRLDYDGDGYTNIEEYINDYLCGDAEQSTGVENDPVEAENIHDGSDKMNTHRSHQILFNTSRRAKAQVFYAEGDSVDIDTANRIDLNNYYDVNGDNYNSSSDFETYFTVNFPNVKNMAYTGEQESLKPETKYSYIIKTYSDTGVEAYSDVYSFTTSAVSDVKPGAPRITKYIPYDKQITLRFEPYSENSEYSQKTGTFNRLLTEVKAPKYDSMIDHYVLRYSENKDMSDAKEILLSGNATSYIIKDLENEKPYYIDLKAVNASGVESDSAVYNFKKAEEQDELDKDGNKTYAVKGLTVDNNKVKEYFYDEPLVSHEITPTKYVVNVNYAEELDKEGIKDGETAKFITYFGDVKDWYIYTLGGMPIPTNNEYSDNKTVMMLRDDSHEHGFTYAKKFDTPLSEKGTIKCRIKVVNEELDPMNQNPELRIYLQEDNATEDTDSDTDSSKEAGSFGTIASITFAKNDINYNGDKIARYVDNEWYDIEMRTDSVEKTCSVYINGELIAENLEYSNHDSDGKTAIQRWQIGSRLAGTEDVYVEYMYAYNGWDDKNSDRDDVEPGHSGGKPSGGGGGGSSSGGTVIRDGDFDTSPKVDKDTEPTPTPSVSDHVNSQFNDMGAYAWAVPAVNALYEKGVVTGVGSNCFAPDRAVTRAEFITMLMRGFSLVGDSASCDFTDVKDGDWCYAAIAMAASMGIVNGRPDGSFGVNDKVTRQDMAVMSVRLANAINLSLSSDKSYEGFNDDADIADYAKESVETLYKSGIVNGTGDGGFAPQGEANRAQAAKIIYELISAQN